jgi:hypothetical protein
MDPNTCLEAVRSACRALYPLIEDGPEPDALDLIEAARALARDIGDLDAWLCRGGAAPDVWAAAAR